MDLKDVVVFAIFFLDEFDKLVATVAGKAKHIGLVVVFDHAFETAAGGEFGLGDFDKLFRVFFRVKVQPVNDG